MKPKIKIVTNYGLVTAITSEGSAIDVEIVEEDTGKEMLFTSRDMVAISPSDWPTKKSTGEACLDDDKIARTGFRTRPKHQNWTVGWPRRKNFSRDRGKLGSAVVDLTVIWEMSA
jgi:hypothetical protein